MINERKLRSEIEIMKAHLQSALEICSKLEKLLEQDPASKTHKGLSARDKAEIKAQLIKTATKGRKR